MLFVLAACERRVPPPDQVTLTPVAFDAVPGWAGDDLAAVLPAWRQSCSRLAGKPSDAVLGPAWAGTAGDWQPVCDMIATTGTDTAALRARIPLFLAPFLVGAGASPDGLITGYFEPTLRGARSRGGAFQVPIHGVPDTMVLADLGAFDPALAGRRFVGRVADGRLVPFFDRGEITAGAVADDTALYWVDDAVAAFELHVQGSGRIELADGSAVRVGFAGHNGFDYTSVGRTLIDRGKLPANRASFDDIRDWMAANPAEAGDVLSINRRYIFFRDIAGDGPIGAAGLVLTAGRSLAVDPAHIPLDIPVWLTTGHPDGDIQRLLIAQDTGNAIKGIVRGDFYWGSGAAARRSANRTKSQGRFYVLLPIGTPGAGLAPPGAALPPPAAAI